jgi:hypothetical protein
MSGATRTEYTLNYLGERFAVWKRNSKLYLRFKRNGKATWRSLRTTDIDTAFERAKKYLDELEKLNQVVSPKQEEITQKSATEESTLQKMPSSQKPKPKKSSFDKKQDSIEDEYNYLYEVAVINVLKFEKRAFDSRVSKRDRISRRNDTFPKTIRRALLAELLSDSDFKNTLIQKEFEEKLACWTPTFRPDLWFIDSDKREVILLEIENTSPLQNKKIESLVNFWWFMENECWNVKCWVFDRYGLNPRQVDLQEIAMARLEAIPIPSGVGQPLGDDIVVPFYVPEEAGGGVRFIKLKNKNNSERV